MNAHKFFALGLLLLSFELIGQDYYSDRPADKKNSDVQTLFGNRGNRYSGGYAALTNKFTSIDGQFANMVGLYGGWFINKTFMIGAGAAATTNYIPVPAAYSTDPGKRMSYEYGQVGLVMEYVISSNRSIHAVAHLMTGSGFTLQYHRPEWPYEQDYQYGDFPRDQNWFFVVEPGVQIELNLLRWLRFSPGVSYRFATNSNAIGLTDSDISGTSFDLTLKVGKF